MAKPLSLVVRCIQAGGALFVVFLILWLLGIFLFSFADLKSFVAATLLRPDYRQEALIPILTEELLGMLSTCWSLIVLAGFVGSLVWLATVAIVRPRGPGQAANGFFAWLLTLGLAAAAAGGGVGYEFVDGDLITANIYTALIVMGAVLAALMFVVGTFFATPRIARPAIPLASILLPG